MGRPTKLTPERHARIIELIRTGAFADTAAAAAGVHRATYYEWMARGRDCERDDDGEAVTEADRAFADFHDAVKEAEAVGETLAIGRIQNHSKDTWQAAAWYLERKYPERWGRVDRLKQEISGPDGGAVEIEAEASVLAFLDERHDRLQEQGVLEDATETTGDPTDVLAEPDITDTPTGGEEAGGFFGQLGGDS